MHVIASTGAAQGSLQPRELCQHALSARTASLEDPLGTPVVSITGVVDPNHFGGALSQIGRDGIDHSVGHRSARARSSAVI